MHFNPLFCLASAAAAFAFQDTIYTLLNDADGTKILSMAIDGRNGKVSSPTLTSADGVGSRGLIVGPPFGTRGSTAGPDGLFGQGAVVVSGNYLFSVNPGSNTLSMFFIDQFDTLHPKLIGKPVDTLGEFPMSVTYSDHLRIACVLNGGAKNGVACFSADNFRGLQPHGPLRPLSKLNTTTPPFGPPDTSSQIQFNPSSSAVFVTIKGAPPPADSGYIYAFPVDRTGRVSTTPVVSHPPKSVLEFSINFLGADSSALVTDPAFGASIMTIAPDFTVTEKAHIVIPLEGAACWGAYSPRHKSAYVIDAGHPNVTVVDSSSGAVKGAIQYEADAKGGFDTVIHNNFMYLLTGDSSVLVIDLNKGLGSEIQKYSLAQQGPAGEWQGMAAWPNSVGERYWEST